MSMELDQESADKSQGAKGGRLNPLVRLGVLASQLPSGLKADWRNTNHFELHSQESGDEYFWWDFESVLNPYQFDTQATVSGQRLGLLMDIAEEVARLRDSGLLPNNQTLATASEPRPTP